MKQMPAAVAAIDIGARIAYNVSAPRRAIRRKEQNHGTEARQESKEDPEQREETRVSKAAQGSRPGVYDLHYEQRQRVVGVVPLSPQLEKSESETGGDPLVRAGARRFELEVLGVADPPWRTQPSVFVRVWPFAAHLAQGRVHHSLCINFFVSTRRTPT